MNYEQEILIRTITREEHVVLHTRLLPVLARLSIMIQLTPIGPRTCFPTCTDLGTAFQTYEGDEFDYIPLIGTRLHEEITEASLAADTVRTILSKDTDEDRPPGQTSIFSVIITFSKHHRKLKQWEFKFDSEGHLYSSN